MNDLDNIYQELGEHICLYPFFGAFYQTNNVIPIAQEGMPNSVRPCSIVMADDMNKWNITNDSIHDTRNAPVWKQMRQDFIQDKFHDIYDCRSCSYNEKSGVSSPRQQNNKFLAQFDEATALFEIKMTGKNLRAEAAKTGAIAGMEFEMIVPNVEGGDDDAEPEPDWDMDESVNSITNIIN